MPARNPRAKLAICLPVVILFVPLHLTAQDTLPPGALLDESSIAAPRPEVPVSAERIRTLILELDHDDYQTRQHAQKALVEVGAPAIGELMEASRSAPSLEVRRRAKQILRGMVDLISGLRHVQTVTRPDLEYVVSAEVSADGRFVYSAAWQAHTVTVFARDPETGELEHVQTNTGRTNLQGALCVRLSPDNRQAVATAIRSKTLVLFERDPESGQLTERDTAREGENGQSGLAWPVEVAWSPDGRFVYVIDARTENAGAVTVFRVTPEQQLELVEVNTGRDGCFANGRGIAVHPNGKTLYATCSDAGTLVVLDRNSESGKTAVVQVVREGEGDVTALAGASSVAIAPDGRFLYISSGRFTGDDAVSVYRIGEDGRVTRVQELLNGQGGLENFLGGNEIHISRDAQRVYAVATRSHTIAAFDRDADTGTLTPLVSFRVGTQAAELGPAGMGVSPDGRHVYVAVESDGALAVFEMLPPPEQPQAADPARD